ncbi:hypothetical protein EU348_00605 [Chryseobacterium indologenes]|uniref:Uncharacterized protein n=1 Tax=Chryseobacterium indologenes TaxID=253 RepID=A0A411DHB1_CHRID|nr:hypothetical protein EU348_00605 [Chryseobacterium indologenes]
MHPLNYSLQDFEKLLKSKITIDYKNYKGEIETISGYLIEIHPTDAGDIKPHSITLDLGTEQRNVNVFTVEKIAY